MGRKAMTFGKTTDTKQGIDQDSSEQDFNFFMSINNQGAMGGFVPKKRSATIHIRSSNFKDIQEEDDLVA